MAAGSGDTASKYVARRETPLYIPENCTQCMECIAVCPDTALPNCSQDLETVLRTAIVNYVTDSNERHKMLALLPEIETRTRALMREGLTTGGPSPAAHQDGNQRGQRLLCGSQAAVVRRHRQGAVGLPEGHRDLCQSREEAPGRRWRVFDFRFGPLQGVCGMRHGVRRSPGSEGWCRKPKTSTQSTRPGRRSWIFCPTHRRSIWASTTTPARRTPRPPPCATC